MRVYVPATLALLGEWAGVGVPASAERFVAPGEDEDSEYAALMSAADASAQMLEGPGRRVVVVGEVGDPDADIAWSRIASVHADVADRPVDADPDEDLGWWATQEVADLLRD